MLTQVLLFGIPALAILVWIAIPIIYKNQKINDISYHVARFSFYGLPGSMLTISKKKSFHSIQLVKYIEADGSTSFKIWIYKSPSREAAILEIVKWSDENGLKHVSEVNNVGLGSFEKTIVDIPCGINPTETLLKIWSILGTTDSDTFSMYITGGVDHEKALEWKRRERGVTELK